MAKSTGLAAKRVESSVFPSDYDTMKKHGKQKTTWYWS